MDKTMTHREAPYKVMRGGFTMAVIQDGLFAGMPIALAMCIRRGDLKLEDVKERGWVYAD